MGGKTRKSNSWAKAAGEYYRANKSKVESFSEVLKSADFRKYYNKKYKMKKGGEGETDTPPTPDEGTVPMAADTDGGDPTSVTKNPLAPVSGGKSSKKSRKTSKKSRKSSKKRFFGIM
jgi:hypothetical protein